MLQLAHVVNDLQTLAAADAAALDLTRTGGDLAEMTGARPTPGPQFEAAGVTLDRGWPRPGARRPALAHQVIANLLTDALKFTRPAAASGSAPDQPAPSRYAVTDTAWASRDDLPHIFDRFFWPPASRVSGSGIGLAMAAELTQAHGRRLTASSEPGQGTQMTLRLPPQPGTQDPSHLTTAVAPRLPQPRLAETRHAGQAQRGTGHKAEGRPMRVTGGSAARASPRGSTRR